MPDSQSNRDTSPAELPFPETGKIAAVDYGTVRIGVAICDPDRILASPLEVIDRRSVKDLESRFLEIARVERLLGFVVGLPVHLDGSESQKSIEARRFAAWLAQKTNLPVRLFDERFSTAAADEKLAIASPTNKQRKKRIDAVAAGVMLEAFIEAQKASSELPGVPVSGLAKGIDSIG